MDRRSGGRRKKSWFRNSKTAAKDRDGWMAKNCRRGKGPPRSVVPKKTTNAPHPHSALSWSRSIHLPSSQLLSLRSTIMLSSNLLGISDNLRGDLLAVLDMRSVLNCSIPLSISDTLKPNELFVCLQFFNGSFSVTQTVQRRMKG
jgi:hypothetical protein